MLPYTPLHVLLLEPEDGFPQALVMTSGNLSEEPIATENDEARERLNSLADGFLMHDRDIQTRCDDSVVRVFENEVYPLRRARGYAPFPVRLPWDAPPLLAAGAELKNAFCMTRGRYGFLSHHIGDMENYETLKAFEEGVTHFERLFHIEPEALVYDHHPDYLATRYVLERSEREGLPAFGVQHHHAHVAACMVENGLSGEQPVIGVSFDGTGFGDDGKIWGGEFLVADYQGYERPFHLEYVPMPGGEIAVRQPWRMALAWLEKAGMEWSSDLPPVRNTSVEGRRTVGSMLKAGINSPYTSSMGRLFDAVAALLGIRSEVNYEAQAAIELEAVVAGDEESAYPFLVKEGLVDAVPAIRAIVADLRTGLEVGRIAARFHNGLAVMIGDVCQRIEDGYGISQVALSGGVWQNMTLLSKTVLMLRDQGFTVLHHRKVPANDGGLALGQAAIATQRLANGALEAAAHSGLTSKV
jgi:hydrogenase maturation protein HypF